MGHLVLVVVSAYVEQQVGLVAAVAEIQLVFQSADLEVEMFLVVLLASLVVLWLVVVAVTEKKES